MDPLENTPLPSLDHFVGTHMCKNDPRSPFFFPTPHSPCGRALSFLLHLVTSKVRRQKNSLPTCQSVRRTFGGAIVGEPIDRSRKTEDGAGQCTLVSLLRVLRDVHPAANRTCCLGGFPVCFSLADCLSGLACRSCVTWIAALAHQVFFRLHVRFVTTVTRLLSPKASKRVCAAVLP